MEAGNSGSSSTPSMDNTGDGHVVVTVFSTWTGGVVVVIFFFEIGRVTWYESVVGATVKCSDDVSTEELSREAAVRTALSSSTAVTLGMSSPSFIAALFKIGCNVCSLLEWKRGWTSKLTWVGDLDTGSVLSIPERILCGGGGRERDSPSSQKEG